LIGAFFYGQITSSGGVKQLTQEIKNALTVLDEFENCYLECDGLTTVISSLLTTAGIPHKVYVGRAACSGKRISPHLWVELENGTIIDYRLRMWLGSHPEIPHGVFNPSDYSSVEYVGQERACFGERDPVALILCMTADIDFDRMLGRLQAAMLQQ
jgi:hypothetical protein